ncbi:MAG TPA: phosphate/phosphite/phosphonate ABC transporter substrate-binding protein [Candidatus Cloacimonadota bacterium]|nr:phosphate/phosphite/phosphonate ABC transporter substrate-binding protein [Candidatus Cloacimonadota bacterium]HPS38899.1 phosphate/phosphite/phosphonate ABC transporter substrate-binding protein [Candidatus Cloacimonadota bacterium]
MKLRYFLVALLALTLFACGSEKSRLDKANRGLGSKKNPIKMYFVPSLEAGKVVSSGEAIAKYLQEETGYYFKVAVPTSYAAVIEALGSNRADIAWLPTFAYIIAKERYDAQVKFMTKRNGLNKYRGQFITRTDSNIKTLEDIQGKIIAYTDASSTSGYIYPSALLKQKGIKPKDMILTGGHSSAIQAVYDRRADVACSYWSPDDSTGRHKDAREKLLETIPDIFDKTMIIGFTDWIPNDTVTYRKELPKEIDAKVTAALVKFTKSKRGVETLMSLYDIDDLTPATDKDYDVVRQALKIMNIDPETLQK